MGLARAGDAGAARIPINSVGWEISLVASDGGFQGGFFYIWAANVF